MHKILKQGAVLVGTGSLALLFFIDPVFALIIAFVSWPILLFFFWKQWFLTSRMAWIVYIVLLVPELIFLTGSFLCQGNEGVGMVCAAGVFSKLLARMLGTALIVAFLGIPYVIYLVALVALPIMDLGAHYAHYQSLEQPSFFTRPRTWAPIFFIILQGVFIFLLIQSENQKREAAERIYTQKSYETSSNKEMDLKTKKSSTEILADEKALQKPVDDQTLVPNFMTRDDLVRKSSQEQDINDWMLKVESRFTEYDLRNNVLVLNDVVERFQEKYGRLPRNSAEFTDFVPVLKPRYKNELERSVGAGWVYGVFYQKRTEHQYVLCVEAQEKPGDIQGFGDWRQEHPLFCIEKSI